jgi:hypothetical protein
MQFEIRFGTAILALAATSGVCSQTVRGSAADRKAPLSSSALTSTQIAVNADVVREIDDPHSGARWLLLRDAAHPGGPGRLVLAGGTPRITHLRETGDEVATTATLPVIRAGDRIILEEHSATTEGRLEAIALGPAAIGSSFAVRLSIGGKVVRALAASPGKAVFQPEMEGRP